MDDETTENKLMTLTIEQLKEIDYVIAPAAYHAYYLKQKQRDWRLHFQLVTKTTFLHDLQFTINKDDAVRMVSLAMGVHPRQARQWVNELTFIPKPPYQDGHLQTLTRVYALCDKEGFISTNPFGQKKYMQRSVLVDGYAQEDGQLNAWFHTLDMSAHYVPLAEVPKEMIVHRYGTIEEEVTAFYNRIAHLVKQHVSLNHIYVLQPPPAYRYELKRQSRYFHLPIQLPAEETMVSLPMVQILLHHLDQGESLPRVMETLLKDHPQDGALLMPILKPYLSMKVTPATLVVQLRDQFSQQLLSGPRYDQAIQVVKDHFPADDDHVFVLGFVQGHVPHVSRDRSLLTDELRRTVGLLTSQQEAEQVHLQWQQRLARTKSLYLSMSQFMEGQPTLESPYVKRFHLTIQPASYLAEGVDYSQQLGVIKYAQFESLATQFHHIHPYLTAYRQRYAEAITPFDHRFTAIDANLQHKPLQLSYSALKDYYQCSFKYFVGRILKVKPMDQDEFYMHLGTFAHEVFELLNDSLTNFEDIFTSTLAQQKQLSAKERVLFLNLKAQLKQVAQFNLHHLHAMNHPRTEAEVKMDYRLDDQTNLIGYIDKVIMVRDDKGQEYIAVVDYKSGGESFEEKLIPFGWSLQLPIYALMLDHHPAYKGKEILGLFIQHIIETSLSPKTVTIDEETFPKSYQLDGIIRGDREVIRTFDQTFSSGTSTFVEGVKVLKKGGLKSNQHIKQAKDFQHYASLAKQKIVEANDGIRQERFAINPKNIDGKSSCEYCPFLDVCFRHDRDITYISTPKEKAVTGVNDGETD